MIQTETFIKIVDNSGVKWGRCLLVPNKKKAYVGDVVTISVQELDRLKGSGKVKKGEIFNCLIIRTKHRILRKDGTYVSFTENAGILLNKNLTPVGSKGFGYSVREIRHNFIKSAAIFERIL